MATVGNFGSVSFYCEAASGISALSFSDMSRNSNANYSEHERNGQKAYLEFGGPGLDEINLTIYASANLKVNPIDVQNQLIQMKNSGQAENFVLGGARVGDNPFVITKVGQNYKEYFRDGRPITIEFPITLKEYANQVAPISNIPAAQTPGQPTEAAVQANNGSYTVEKGDCLWNIAKEQYGDPTMYTKIYEANKDKISNPNLIYPGQELVIPS